MVNNFVVTKIERVAMVGKEEYPQEHIVFGNDITCNELIFHFSGQSTVFYDSVVLQTKANSIRFLPKMKVSRYEVFHQPGDCILIDFQTDIPVSDVAFTTYSSQNEFIGTLFRKLFLCWSSKREGYYFECLSIIYDIFAQMTNRQYLPVQYKKQIDPAVRKINRDFLNQTIEVTELASLCNMSISYLKQLFNMVYGVPPKKYMIGLKINHACELLRSGQLTIQQIADECRYSDVYFFSRQFKQYTGVSPTEFQKKYFSSK